jgi:Tol biopolymer transport system component
VPGNFDIDAQVSPNGGWVTYEHDSPGSETIHLVKPNGEADHVLDLPCADPCFGSDAPTWLSSRRIAFLRVVGPFDPVTGNAVSAVLYSVRVDGTHLHRLSEPGIDGVYEDRYARVSSDRSYLMFQRLRLADNASALFRMTPGGSHVRQLTPWDIHADLYDLSTAGSGPTRDLIAFQSFGRGNPDATFADIGFLPATCNSVEDCTSRIVWMTDNSATGRRNSSPQWSPDGSSLVFIDRPSIDDPNAEIWTTRFGGTETQRRNISNSVNFDYRPAWGR